MVNCNRTTIYWYGIKAESQLVAEKFTDGLESVERALHFAKKTGDMFFAPRIHAIAAELHHRLGNSRESDSHTFSSLKLANRFGIAPKAYTLANQITEHST